MNKIQVTGSDWYILNSTKSNTQELNYESFIEQSKKQLDKYEMILSKKIQENKKGTEREVVEELFIDDCQLVLDEKKFNRLCQTAKKLNSEFCPILSYHGTPNIENINNIAKYGYLLPG